MAMKKFINDSETLTKELLKGMALAFPDKIEVRGNNLVINKNIEKADRVHIVTLGGAGHEPALSGFVGDGMFDISVVGDVFAAPGPAACFEALSLAAAPKGALFVVLNHAGDMMTAEMTMEQVEDAGIKVARVTTQEDISNAPRSDAHKYYDRIEFMVDPEHNIVKKASLVYDPGKREVHQQAAEGYRHQEQRLKVLSYRKIEQDKRDEQHQKVAGRESDKPGLINNAFKSGHVKFHCYLPSGAFLSSIAATLPVTVITSISPIITRKTILIEMKDIISAPIGPTK